MRTHIIITLCLVFIIASGALLPAYHRPLRGWASHPTERSLGSRVPLRPLRSRLPRLSCHPPADNTTMLQDACLEQWYPDTNKGNDGAVGSGRTAISDRSCVGIWWGAMCRPASISRTAPARTLYALSDPRRADRHFHSQGAAALAGKHGDLEPGSDRCSVGAWPGVTVWAAIARPQRLASRSILASDPISTWYTWTVTSLVQDWVDNPAGNLGMILIPGSSTVRYHFTSAEGTAVLRPRLVIRYTERPPTPTPTLPATATPTSTAPPTVTPTVTPSGTPGGAVGAIQGRVFEDQPVWTARRGRTGCGECPHRPE